MTKTFWIIGIISILILVGIVSLSFYYANPDGVFNGQSSLLSDKEYSKEQLDTFAKCVAENDMTMYGAYWCPHCKDQKALFGESFQYVPYVECTENENICIEKDITGYPSWITGSGQKIEGGLKLESIAQITGCALDESLTNSGISTSTGSPENQKTATATLDFSL